MITGAPSLARFVLRTLAWLPPCFAAWYLGAQIHTGIAAALARLVVAFFNAAIIKATEYPGLELRFVTTIEVPSAAGRGVLAIEVNPLLYTYGLALFLALMLAARARWRHVLLGAAILLPFQGWGIGFDLLAHLGVKLGPEVSAQAGLLGSREFIALAYQVGNLIFPSVVPVILWAFFNREFIERLRPATQGDAHSLTKAI